MLAKKLLEWSKKGNRKKLEEWVVQTGAAHTEKEQKKLMESWEYIKKNWKGRSRIKKEAGVIGRSTESHISYVLSAGISSRPMGWSREGTDKLSQIRIYWKNDRDMLKLEQIQKEEIEEESQEEEKYLSAGEMLA